MRPPICEVCDKDLERTDGALLEFRNDSPATDVADGTAGVGHPAHMGWFCLEHREDAEALRHLRQNEAVREIRSPFFVPGIRMRRLFERVAITRSVEISPRIMEGIQPVFLSSLSRFQSLFNEELRCAISGGGRQPMPPVPQYPRAADYQVSSAPYVSERGSVRLIERQWLDEERDLLASHGEVVVCVDGAVRLIIDMTPELNDPLTIRTLIIRQDPTFADVSLLNAAAEGFASALMTPEFDPLAVEPDLVGVDLCGGRLEGSVRFEQRSVRWPVAQISVGSLERHILDRLDQILSAYVGGNVVAPRLESSKERTWNPMDRMSPPNCPYSDQARTVGSVATSSGQVEVLSVRTHVHWNDDDIANASVRISLRNPGGSLGLLALSAYTSSGVVALEVHLDRPTTGPVIEAIGDLVASLR